MIIIYYYLMQLIKIGISIIKMIYKNSLKINYLIWNDDKLKTNR